MWGLRKSNSRNCLAEKRAQTQLRCKLYSCWKIFDGSGCSWCLWCRTILMHVSGFLYVHCVREKPKMKFHWTVIIWKSYKLKSRMQDLLDQLSRPTWIFLIINAQILIHGTVQWMYADLATKLSQVLIRGSGGSLWRFPLEVPCRGTSGRLPAEVTRRGFPLRFSAKVLCIGFLGWWKWIHFNSVFQ